MRCKHDYDSRSGRERRYDVLAVVRALKRAEGPQTKEQIIASLGGGVRALNLFRTAVENQMIEPLPGGFYKLVHVRPPPLNYLERSGNGPRIAPAHATHVNRHRPGIRRRK